MDELLRNIQDAWNSFPQPAAAVAAALAAIVVLIVLWRQLRRRKPVSPPPAPPPGIELAAMGDAGPPAEPPVLECFNIPVRLAAVVLAPVGRSGELPSDQSLTECFDALVPGLDRVVAAHQPLVRRWPTQLAASGFARTFFATTRLPGDGGKGTPWCAAAGAVRFRGSTVMVALVLRAAAPNGLGQMVFDSEEKWLACLRVKMEK